MTTAAVKTTTESSPKPPESTGFSSITPRTRLLGFGITSTANTDTAENTSARARVAKKLTTGCSARETLLPKVG